MLLGVDLGTTAVKLVLVGADGRVVARADRSFRARADAPGHFEQDPDDWWAATGEAAAELAAAGHPLGDVDAVGLSGQTHGLVLLDGDDRPVRPCLTWADQRAVAETRELAARVGERVRERCANPLIESFTLPKLLWVSRHEPELLRRARRLALPKDVLRHRLTGTWETDPTDAASTLFYDLFAGRWDEELLAAAEAEPALLPAVRPSASVAGRVTRAAGERLGLREGTPVVTGASDVACAALGAGVDEAGAIYVNLGTAAQLMTPVEPPIAPGAYTFLAAGDRGYLAMASVYAAGRSLDWVVDELLQGPLGRRDAPDADRYARVEAAVSAVPPGSGGLMFLPHLLGASTPWLDATARGALLGLTPAHGQAETLRAVIEGVALAIRIALEQLAPNGSGPRLVRLGGGPARSPAWSQVLADACGAEIDVVGPDSSAMGAAMLAGIAAGAFSGPADAIARCVRVERRVSPDGAAAEVYDRHAVLFRQACDALAPVFQGLAR